VRGRLQVLDANGKWGDLGDVEFFLHDGTQRLPRAPLGDLTITLETESLTDPDILARILKTPKPERPSFLEGVRSRLRRRRCS
jgi:hypothetical protein